MWLLAGWPQFLADCWPKASVLHAGLSESCLHVRMTVAAGKLTSDVRKSKQARERERETKTGDIVFYNLILEVTHHPFHHILLVGHTRLVTQTNLDTLWEGPTQGCDYQEAAITGGCLGSWLP